VAVSEVKNLRYLFSVHQMCTDCLEAGVGNVIVC